MSTNANKRNPSVKPNEHSGFALELASYLNKCLAGMSGREFARRAAAGGVDHWAKIIAGTKVMTTNDIKVAAEVFGVTPYEFVARARPGAADVGGLPDDIPVLPRAEERELRARNRIAAKRGRNEAEGQHED